MKVTHPSMAHSDTPTDLGAKELKVYTVAPADDEALFDQQMESMEQEINKTPAATTSTPTEDPVLKREVDRKLAFEKLMFLSQDQFKEIEYGGLNFKFKVLKSSDNARILTILQRANLDEAYKASVMALAASIVSVNDIAFEDFYTGTEKIEDPLVKRYIELSKWPAFMVTALMGFSSGVQSEVEKEFHRDFLKA